MYKFMYSKTHQMQAQEPLTFVERAQAIRVEGKEGDDKRQALHKTLQTSGLSISTRDCCIPLEINNGFSVTFLTDIYPFISRLFIA
jgi:hypothetical protein